jgi:hypothetical protein
LPNSENCGQAAFRRITPYAVPQDVAVKQHRHKSTGPYHELSFTRKGRSNTKFVRKEDLPEIRKQLKNYERMKLLVDQWIDLANELSNLRITQNRKRTCHSPVIY